MQGLNRVTYSFSQPVAALELQAAPAESSLPPEGPLEIAPPRPPRERGSTSACERVRQRLDAIRTQLAGPAATVVALGRSALCGFLASRHQADPAVSGVYAAGAVLSLISEVALRRSFQDDRHEGILRGATFSSEGALLASFLYLGLNSDDQLSWAGVLLTVVWASLIPRREYSGSSGPEIEVIEEPAGQAGAGPQYV
ncbi:hypothetical protein JI739_00815 [Ramlibacter sp. AW1]|uniref:Uncharacterized protein n=1 Tax=Ramlibacter aurantiacus TaxID=2801330 RepID=A0A936ZJG3_9BURK|nr:hypothetical protein [Ramlibacter aurantiacus]MBL0418876.1 hypothetical protein [Ramlibacter aurantiacus]